jgi:hypothetical protein
MISILPPSIFPTSNPVVTPDEQAPVAIAREQPDPSQISNTVTTGADDSSSTLSGDGRPGVSERSGLFQTAKHMVRNAFKEFRHDLRDSFSDLGFDGGLANQISKGVMHATRDALRTGIDFSAKLMVAAISQTTTIGASGTSSSFSMVARSIEVNINHTTGSVDVSMMKVSIEGEVHRGLGGTEPHLLDIHDSDQFDTPDLTGATLDLADVGDILGEDEEPAIVATQREALDGPLDDVDEDATIRTAVGTLLQSTATDDEEPVDEVDETEEAREVSDVPVEVETALPEIETPLLLNRPEYSARIFITAYQHSINEREESITFMRFDAVVPLSTTSIAPTEETAAVDPVLETETTA